MNASNEHWSLQDAKARFSELVKLSLSAGAQVVSLHGKPVVAIVPLEEYRRLIARTQSLSAFLAKGPRVDLDISRSRDSGREFEL